MARLSDIPTIYRRVGPLKFALRVWNEVIDDALFTWASALAYSWLFAIFPFFIFLLSLLPHLPAGAKGPASEEIHGALYSLLPRPAADTLWPNVAEVLSRPRQGLLGVGILITLWAASGGMAATMTALDRCYEIERSRRFHKQRALAMVLTIAVATLIVGVLVLLPVGTAFIRRMRDVQSISAATALTINVARWSVALLFLFGVVAVVYHFGIRIKQRFRPVTPGGVFTIGVWIGLGVLFRFYIDHVGSNSYSRTYGTVGGVAILLLFFYIDALVLLIGAEINSEIDYEVLGVPRGSSDFRGPYKPPVTAELHS